MGEFNYDKEKELVEQGANLEILKLPAIRERIEKGYVSKVNNDGTIDFYKMHMNKEEDGTITLESSSKEEAKVHYISDDPIGDPYGYVTEKITAEKIYINKYGIEEKKITKVKDDVNGDSTEKICRKDGLLTVERIEENGKKEYFEIYDVGNIEIDGDIKPENKGTKSNEIKDAIYKLEKNQEEYIEKYPNLKEYYLDLKENMLNCIDKKENELNKQNDLLEENNEKLQKMLKKSLDFAENVRSSVIGKVFFGKAANEVLGEKNKDVTLLDEGEER